jgi:anti-anti-sigma regulatory factor
MTGTSVTPDEALQNGQSDRLSFTLPAIMTIETVEPLAVEFKQLPLTDKNSLVLDAAQVENITTPALQLIVSLEKTLATQGNTLIIANPRDALIQACRDLGFEQLLGKAS